MTQFDTLFKICKPFSMTCRQRMKQLHESVVYVIESDIPGDFVETGVWKGGNLMLMALTLKALGVQRKIWGFDTFEGMPPGGEHDIRVDGKTPDFSSRNNLVVPLEQVSATLQKKGCSNITLVKGMVEHTIPQYGPESIAILRTDTDFYESTRFTIQEFYPRLSPAGVFINDDYYHFAGAKKAVDEIIDIPFTRIGESNAIAAIKPAS